MTVTLIPATSHGANNGDTYDGESTTWYSNKTEGDGYYGYTDGFHTAAVFFQDVGDPFDGTITMQGTLATSPGADDWFDIEGASFTLNDSTPIGYTKNFTGNFVWIRAKVSDHTEGGIAKLQFNY